MKYQPAFVISMPVKDNSEAFAMGSPIGLEVVEGVGVVSALTASNTFIGFTPVPVNAKADARTAQHVGVQVFGELNALVAQDVTVGTEFAVGVGGIKPAGSDDVVGIVLESAVAGNYARVIFKG